LRLGTGVTLIANPQVVNGRAAVALYAQGKERCCCAYAGVDNNTLPFNQGVQIDVKEPRTTTATAVNRVGFASRVVIHIDLEFSVGSSFLPVDDAERNAVRLVQLKFTGRGSIA
jgi:hypothetical protein